MCSRYWKEIETQWDSVYSLRIRNISAYGRDVIKKQISWVPEQDSDWKQWEWGLI